jgi:hypothetical protein
MQLYAAQRHSQGYVPNGKPRGRPRKNEESQSKQTSRPPGRPKRFQHEAPLPGFKNCSKCLILKEETKEFFNKSAGGFHGLSADCKKCRSDYNKEYKAKDPEKRAEGQRASHYKHREKRKIKTRKYHEENRDALNAKRRKKRQENPMVKLADNIRRAVSGATKYNGFVKSSKLSLYLGCNSQEFKAHLESLWQPGMSWDNYGYGEDKWNIDHITPMAEAKSVEDLYRLNHFSNFQPLWQKYNFLKRDKSPEEWDAYKLANGIL